jgi:hypothetical protein
VPAGLTTSLVFTLPLHTRCIPLSYETFRGEPATRQFDWSFAPTPRSRDRFERQNRYAPPPAFPQASRCPGIAHCLSGLIVSTIDLTRTHYKLLGPCFKTGATKLPSMRSISRRDHNSHWIPSQYLFAIGHRSYLALDAHNHPFTLHYQTVLLKKIGLAYGAVTLYEYSFQNITCTLYNRLSSLPLGLIRFHSPLLTKSSLFSFPPFNDMLKSKGLS